MSTLPAPPEHSTGPTGAAWSIVTLAAHLCVAPDVVHAALTAPEFPDLHDDHVTYRDVGADRDWMGNCWLYDEAAERIAAQFPAAAIARAILADRHPRSVFADDRDLCALAEHVVTHGGAT